MRPVLTEALQAAAGRASRDDPIAAGTGGPAGNARLTAWTGLLLLVLSVAELITLIDVSGLISWHIVIGTLLVPPALLKTASTGWRIVRYYRGDARYHHGGPPPVLLRFLGPGVVAATGALLGSGLILTFIGEARSRIVLFSALGQRVDYLTLHQGAFILWAVLTGLHVLARTLPALHLTVLTPRTAPAVDGARGRAVLLTGTVIAAAVTAALVLAASQSWRHDRRQPEHHTIRLTPHAVVISSPTRV